MQQQAFTERRLSQPEALARFNRLCDEASTKSLGETVSRDNRHVIFNLFAKLGPVYGIDESRAAAYADGFLATFGRGENEKSKEKKSTVGLNFTPYQIIDALRDSPKLFAKYPTEGMLRAAIRGHRLEDFPADWVRGGDRVLVNEQAPLADDNPFEVFARECEQESESLGLSPDAETPKEIGARRAKRLQELMSTATKGMAMPYAKPVSDAEPSPVLTGRSREPGEDDAEPDVAWTEHEGKPIQNGSGTDPEHHLSCCPECGAYLFDGCDCTAPEECPV